MVTYSGLILPESIERDIKIINSVCSCETMSLDLVNREIEVFNFTVTSLYPEAEDDDALRIGRICVRWDSYFKPCVEIEIDDIDIIVEFLNVLLTKNNWGLLREYGFPPKLYTSNTGTDTSSKNSFVRIGGIDLRGVVTLTVKSLPLKETVCQDLVFDLEALNDLNEFIRVTKKTKSGDRQGCTTVELYTIIELYFANKLKSMLKATAYDFLRSQAHPDIESAAVRHAKAALSGTKDSFTKYVKSTRQSTVKQLEKNFSQKLQDLGFASTIDVMNGSKSKIKNEDKYYD